MLKLECDDIYVLGGAVRNTLAGIPFKDVDFFMPREVRDDLLKLDIFRRGKLLRGPIGSPRWVPSPRLYFDFVAIEDVSQGFLPNSNTIVDVINRMDYTGNAVAFQPLNGVIIDPHDGIRDINNSIMRAVRFDVEDIPVTDNSNITWRATLWLRIISYSIKLNWVIEPNTLRWLKENADCIRYYDEFERKFSKLSFTPDFKFSDIKY